MNKVEVMKKISLEFTAGTSDKNMDLVPGYPPFEFIFGLGPEGMTPFEYELLDRKVGEEVVIRLHKQNYETLFEHLQPPLLDLFDGREQVFLKARIISVGNPENREVIKAMARMADYREGECGCECGCGCS